MPNYHGYKCPNCKQELDGYQVDNQSKRDIHEDEYLEEWRVLYWCPEGHGVKILWIEETTVFEPFEGDSSFQEIVFWDWDENR